MISARVRKAVSSQFDLLGKGEHCSADPDRLAVIGREVGHQVRIVRTDSEYALYTISEPRAETPDHVIRMALAARERLGAADEFDAIIDAQVPHPTFTEAQAELHGELIEQLEDDGEAAGLVVLAPHGGQIESYTDRQAELVRSGLLAKGVSMWRCKGWKRGGGAYQRWHITSPEINEASFPRLQKIIERRFALAVAFHGFGEAGILVGGAAPGPLRNEIKAAIESAVAGSGIPVRIPQPEEQYGGDDPRNIVNRLCEQNGVQIEQSSEARQGYWQAIADAVASVLDRYL